MPAAMFPTSFNLQRRQLYEMWVGHAGGKVEKVHEVAGGRVEWRSFFQSFQKHDKDSMTCLRLYLFPLNHANQVDR